MAVVAVTQHSQPTVPKELALPVPSPTKPTSAAFQRIMSLSVGGRRFEVRRYILERAETFRYWFSDKFKWRPQPDGYYFVDTNWDVFGHVLDFLRRPTVFPLFWSKTEGSTMHSTTACRPRRSATGSLHCTTGSRTRSISTQFPWLLTHLSPKLLPT